MRGWVMMVGRPKHIMRGGGNTLDSFCCYLYRNLVVVGEMVDVDWMKKILGFSLGWVMMVWGPKQIMWGWGNILHSFCCYLDWISMVFGKMVDVDWMKRFVCLFLRMNDDGGGSKQIVRGWGNILDSFCCYLYRTLVVIGEMVDADQMKQNFVLWQGWLKMVWGSKHICLRWWGHYIILFCR